MFDTVVCQLTVDDIIAGHRWESGYERMVTRIQSPHTYQTTSLKRNFERYIITPEGRITYADYQPAMCNEDNWDITGEINNFSGELELVSLISGDYEDYTIKLKAIVETGQLIEHYMGNKIQLLECRAITKQPRIDFYKELNTRAAQNELLKSRITYKIKTFFEKMKFTK